MNRSGPNRAGNTGKTYRDGTGSPLAKAVLREILKIGEKKPIYVARRIASALGLRPRDGARLTVKDNGVMAKLPRDPLHMALEGRKYARLTPDDVEVTSAKEQLRYLGDSS